MISLPFRRGSRQSTIEGLYGAIVAQARLPAFYRDYGVPDTVSARIDMIMLHLVVVLRRLREGGAQVRAVSQPLFDRFCQDMDDNFREMGIGDLKVPKEMQAIGEAFYGRARSYDAALDAEDTPALILALGRNVYGSAQPPLAASRLAAYIRKTVGILAEQSDDLVARTELKFPDPETIDKGGRREQS